MLRPSVRGKMVTLDTADDRTLHFDFLPVEFGTHNGFSVKLKLFTVPGQGMHRSTRKVVLVGADGVAVIADSQRSSASANQYSWRDMEANLKANGIDFPRMPNVVQFNKRDLPDVKPLEEIRAAWGDIPTFRRWRARARACSRPSVSCCAAPTGPSTRGTSSRPSSASPRTTS
jgi:signal recognition particle receptor subunit beta